MPNLIPIPANEAERIKALKEYNLLDTLDEKEFDRLTELASVICGVPIALVSLIDTERQWFKSKIGLDAPQTPRDISFCQFAIMGDNIFEVTDAAADDRFKNNPLVTGSPDIRFYAGYPLIDDKGYALGTLCVIDREPKKLSPDQQKALTILGQEVVSQIIARKERMELHDFTQLFCTSLDMVCVAGTDGHFKRINPAFVQTLGWSEKELLDKPFFDFIHPDDIEKTGEEIKKLAEGVKTINFINRYLMASGEYITLNWMANPDPTNGNLYAIARDITERIKIESELKKAKQEAEKSVFAKDQFLANMSHEIRTPMNAILGFADILETTNLNNEQKEYLSAISNSGENLMVIINDILDFSKIEAGRLSLEKQPISITKIINHVKKLLLHRAKDRNLSFNFYVENDIPEWVIGDSVRLNQILINLLGNSIKFTEHGKVELFCNLLQKANNDCEIQFTIKDTGIGIPINKQELIFERFKQADDNTTRKFGGTGLGLSITKKLVELFEGTMQVKSEEGVGSEFSVTIPFKITESNNAQILENTKEIREFANYSILLTEDNDLNQKLAKHILEANNMTVEIAANGQIAVDILREKQFDIILMDLQMPVMDGYVATSFIRNVLKINTPIIAMTAHSLVGEKEKCVQGGMNEYISKPYKAKELIDKIKLFSNGISVTVGNSNTPTPETISNEYDLSDLVELSNGDDKFVKEMITIFIKEIPQELSKLNLAVKQEKVSECQRIAHKIKSTYSMFKVSLSAELCNKIEHEESLIEISKHVELITKESVALLKKISSELVS